MKLRPTDPLQKIVATLFKDNSLTMVNPTTLATVILVLRLCSPDKNTTVLVRGEIMSGLLCIP